MLYTHTHTFTYTTHLHLLVALPHHVLSLVHTYHFHLPSVHHHHTAALLHWIPHMYTAYLIPTLPPVPLPTVLASYGSPQITLLGAPIPARSLPTLPLATFPTVRSHLGFRFCPS